MILGLMAANPRHYFFTFNRLSKTSMKFSFLIISLLLTFSNPGYSQKQLVLIKQNKIVLRISEGEFIRFKRKDQNHFTRGFIGGIQQEYFRIGDDTTYLYNVAAIDLHGRPNSSLITSRSGITLIIAGAVLTLIDALNSNDVASGTVAVSGALITSGIVMQFFNNDIFKIGRKKKIITMGD